MILELGENIFARCTLKRPFYSLQDFFASFNHLSSFITILPKSSIILISITTIAEFTHVFTNFHLFETEERRLRRDEILDITYICDGGIDQSKLLP